MVRGWNAIWHETKRSCAGARRWRVVVQVSRPMTGDEFPRVLANVKVARPGAYSRTETDASRLWFLPAGRYAKGRLTGNALDVDRCLSWRVEPARRLAPPEPVRARTAYQEGALRIACERVASAGVGHRNVTLNREAWCLVARCDVPASIVADRLLVAALDAGLPRWEALATLRSALRRR